MIIWFTGISGVGKTTIAKKLHALLSKKLILIDGDALRKINNYDLGYTKKDRDVNAKGAEISAGNDSYFPSLQVGISAFTTEDILTTTFSVSSKISSSTDLI